MKIHIDPWGWEKADKKRAKREARKAARQEMFNNFARKHPDATFVLVFGGLGGVALAMGNVIGFGIILGVQHLYRVIVG